jgi:hypothetical protein
MKCPHCEYEDCEETIGEDGMISYKFNQTFYKLPVELKDETIWYPNTVSLYGCPECKKVFIS